MSGFYSFVRIVIIVLFKFIYPWEVRGRDNLPPKGRYIVCPNHISNMDPVLLIASQKRQINFMAKSELFKNKLLGKILYSLGTFPVERKKGDVKAVNKSFEILENDDALGVFIEGTRSKDGEFLKPKSGAAMISYKTNSPVIPVCITPKKGKKIKPFTKTIISFGTPILTSQLGIESGTGLEFRNASRVIMSEIKKLREQLS